MSVNPDFNKLLKEALDRMDKEIKPCPLCGGKVGFNRDTWGQWRFYHTCKNGDWSDKVYINGGHYKTKHEAIKAWNRRVS